jgi:hypothetical protein
MGYTNYWRVDGTCQQVTAGASSAASAAFGTQTRYLRLCANTAVHYAVNASPTASTSTPYLPAHVIEIVKVTPGQKIAAIQAATAGLDTETAGTLSVTELSE